MPQENLFEQAAQQAREHFQPFPFAPGEQPGEPCVYCLWFNDSLLGIFQTAEAAYQEASDVRHTPMFRDQVWKQLMPYPLCRWFCDAVARLQIEKWKLGA